MTLTLPATSDAAAPPLAPTPAPQPSRRARLRRLPADIVVPAVVLGVLAIAAAFPGLFATTGPLDVNPAAAFQAPSADHWFGTDESGRDVFSRVVHGTRDSLAIGAVATLIGLGLAVVLGAAAALGGRVADFVLSRAIEVLFAFPGLLLALVVITILGPGVVTTTIAVGLSTAPGYARIVRTQVASVRRSGYVEAAIVSGKSPAYVLRRHILPNVAAPLSALATLGLGQAIVWAAALSFLGLGAAPPAPEWGAMLSAGRLYIGNAWWLSVFPGLLVVITASAGTLLGRAIQQRIKER